ncbi:MAG: ABC-type phosphate transport system, periplasmic component [Firmicutes bacterium]|nr:ABC-type phosphate transport system, periplasmic component [Bacillota bacterium]
MAEFEKQAPQWDPEVQSPGGVRRYVIRSLIWTLLLVPAVFGILCWFTAQIHPLLSPALGGILTAVFLRYRAGRKGALPQDALWRYFPVLLPLGYYLLVFVAAFGLSGYQFGSNLFQQILLTMSAPWFGGNFLLAFMGDFASYPLMITLCYGGMFVVFLLWDVIRKPETLRLRRGTALFGACLLLGAVCAFQFHARSAYFLDRDYSVLKVENEVDLWPYDPDNRENILYVPREAPTLTITENYPRLDGATALYPVYSALAQAVYQGLEGDATSEDLPIREKYPSKEENSRWHEVVQCSKTSTAYERLIRGEVDVIFVLQPSKEQLAAAEAAGVQMQLHPIGKEAFVFFVNSENPVSNLTQTEIQDIYQKKITNWKTLGGENESILPFQRPANSGSQTAMEAFMEGKELPTPLREEYAAGMGGIVDAVAAYRNYTGAVGYSFRFFATGMKTGEGLKLLAIDGIAPTVEHIADNTYPLTFPIYAVTAKEPEGNVKALLDYLTSPQGQEMVEGCGYVPLDQSGS